MAVRLREFDGAREVNIEAKDGRVFLWGDGFCYQFDLSMFMHQMRREVCTPAHVLGILAAA